MSLEFHFDTVIIGAGHAGIEAALASARLGHKTALITINTENCGAISCNPSIGGLGKSHLVKEIDVLGGEMAKIADKAAIQYKVLNKSKGMAVWSLRAQIDKFQYNTEMTNVLLNQKNLHLFQDTVTELLIKKKTIYGVKTERGLTYFCKTAILCTGTFLKGKIYIGDYVTEGGRIGELNSKKLSSSLLKHKFKLERFKTGTPPRINKNTIDFSKLEISDGDSDKQHFSIHKIKNKNKHLPCFITYTSEDTHNIIRKNKSRSPLYSGKIEGIGPRYCPSIEDKVFKFPDKERHQIYLEPEGLNSNLYYINGLSSSMPEEVQLNFCRTLPGLENVEFVKPAYAIEYDYISPIHLKLNLESKNIKGLFFAGQINGTSGYEEAACQGLIAGINSSKYIKNEEAFILSRYESYIGVLIDDLIHKGTTEPYRMFTSRAENRLSLRLDNADTRLSKYGFEIGLLDKKSFKRLEKINKDLIKLKKEFENLKLSKKILQEKFNISKIEKRSIPYLFTRTDININDLIDYLQELTNKDINIIQKIAADIKYAGYVKKQEKHITRAKKYQLLKIPKTFNYKIINGLKKEALTKLTEIKPDNIQNASNIPGITPSDIQLIIYHLQIKGKKSK